MKAEYLIINECGKWKVVEEIGEEFPDICVAIFPETFIVEAVHLGDLAWFMIPSEDGDSLGKTDFQSHKKGHSLNGIVASIYIIACKDAY